MSGNNYQPGSYGDDLDHQDGATGGGLRAQLEKMLADNKVLMDRLSKYEQQERATSAETVLKGKGLDPAIKELIPADADPAEWVDKYAHLLGVKGTERDLQAAPSDVPDETAQVDDDPALVAEREALALIQGAADAGSPAHLTGDVLERMDKISSEEELLKFFDSNGAVGG